MKETVTRCDVCKRTIDGRELHGETFKLEFRKSDPDDLFTDTRVVDVCGDCKAGMVKSYFRAEKAYRITYNTSEVKIK